MVKFYKAFFLLLFLITLANSQNQNIKFEKISIGSGLPQNLMRKIVQDQQGFLWIGTISGLMRFDGYTAKVYYAMLGDSNSISNNNIGCLLIDRKNILWIGTPDGLNAYDIKNDTFTHFQNDPYDHTSISNNIIRNICEDISGNIWIGTDNGLNKYDKKKNIFIRYYYSDQISEEVDNTIRCVIADNENNILFGTSNGLYKIFAAVHEEDDSDPSHPISKSIRRIPTPRTSWGEDLVFKLYKDHSGIIWIGTPALGLIRYDSNSDTLTRIRSKLHNGDVITNMGIKLIYQDRSGTLWIGSSFGKGLFTYDKKSKQLIYRALEGKGFQDILEDQSGVLWISVTAEGLRKYCRENQKFPRFIDKQSLAVLSDKNGDLWLGNNNGIYKYNRKTRQFSKFELNPYRINPINTIFQDSKDRLWIGSRDVYEYNRYKNKFEMIEIDYEHSINLPAKADKASSFFRYEIFRTTYLIYEDKMGDIWICASTGLYKYNLDTKILVRYSHDPININSISDNRVKTIYQDNYGNYWVGTQRGLNKFDPVSETFNRYMCDHTNPHSISNSHISDIYESRFNIDGPLWIATNGGLNSFDRENEVFTQYSINDGLSHNTVMSILEDNHVNLWLGTLNGLSKFNPKTKKFKNYYKSDGLQDYWFTYSHFRNKKGEMFFGGINSLSIFHPDSIKDDLHIPPIVLTKFKKFNKDVKLDTSISHIKQITLDHDEKVISFEFAALNYANPQENQFAYMMEGFDEDWIYSGYKHDATYTNLDPGEYVFRVKGSNQDGIWNETGTSIRIIITPPWWRTNLAYSIYVLLIATMLFGIWRFQRNRLIMKQQMEMEHFEVEKLREVDKLKSRFFANISHEFRTPLTLIKGPIKQMLQGEFVGNIIDQYKMILRNSDRLLGFINQILDLSKLESGEVKLQVTETDIVQYLKGMILSFSPLAETKKVTLKFISAENVLTGYVDRDKLEKIVTNFLSNAFKFTPEGGEIEVKLKIPNTKHQIPNKSQFPNSEFLILNSNSLELSISNIGPGIPDDQLDKIFDRFYQADDNYKKDGEGSGIGLALTKELVEVCRGEISVDCQKFVGQSQNLQPPESPRLVPTRREQAFYNGDIFLTKFTVKLPITKESFKEDEIIGTTAEEIDSLFSKEIRGVSRPEYNITELKEEVQLSKNYESKSKSKKSAPLLLIVEDNPDVTNYISSFMENDFRLITAENGKAGLKKTLDKYPDLIISDVMMPEMDGVELCHKVKSDERISHIPIILLTAKADLDSKIEGLEFGADDYVTKPFEARELQIRSKNLIEQRRKLREKFSLLVDLSPADIAASSMDEQLLQRLLAVFENHIEEPDFSIVQLSREIGMSRMHLNRKIQAITNLSTSDFIRTLRLQRAAKLLRSASGTVSEIAYKVGFNNLSYFSRAFRTHFGKLPSEFIKE